MPKASLQVAVSLWKAERPAEALRMLQHVVQSEPDNEQAWLWIARVSTSRDQRHRALLRVLDINPENATAKRVLEQQFGGHGPGVRDHINNLLADATFETDPRRAEALYEKVLDLDPISHEALDGILPLYRKAGVWARGFRMLDRARQHAPNDETIIRHTIHFGLLSNDLDYLRGLDEIWMTSPHVKVEELVSAAKRFANDKQFDVVAALLERGSEIDPQNQTVLFGLMRAYQVLHRFDDAKRIQKQIADVDAKSKIGKSMMETLLDEDPYVPLATRESTFIAVRELVGLLIPIGMLVILDNRLGFGGIETLLAILTGVLGGYLLVSATSSHEQKLLKRFEPNGLDPTMRWIFGIVGAALVVMAVYFALPTSVDNADDSAYWESEACWELLDLFAEGSGLTITPTEDVDACDWLRDIYGVGSP